MLPQEWLKEMFEFEDCDECGKGAEDHEVITVLGNYFAYCTSIGKEESNTDKLDPQQRYYRMLTGEENNAN